MVVKFKVWGISTETREDHVNWWWVRTNPNKEFELVAEGTSETASVILKNVEFESSLESATEDGVGMTYVDASGAELRGPTKESELIAEGTDDAVSVILKDVDFDSSEESIAQDSVGITDEGADRAEQSPDAASVILKDAELESSEESTPQDGVGMTYEGDFGDEQRGEGGNLNSVNLPLEEEGEEEDCGFCLFMKAGPCGERFSNWQECVDAAEKSGEDILEKCSETGILLKVCMDTNLEYYGPVVDAQRAMEEVASQNDNRTADAEGKPTDQDKGTEDISEKE